jgi:hypothetical protein
VQPCTRISPIVGSRSAFGPATRICWDAPTLDRLRSRKLGTDLCRDLTFGNPTVLPALPPLRESEKFTSAWAAFTLAHSNTSAFTSALQARPTVPSSLTREESSVPFFHALNSLMKLNFDHDRDGVRASPASPYVFSASHWSRFAFTRAR